MTAGMKKCNEGRSERGRESEIPPLILHLLNLSVSMFSFVKWRH